MSIDLNSKCRTCLNESSIYYQLLDDVEENYKILEMLDCMVPQINIKSTPQFSTSVCQTCVEKLLIGYKYQQLCLESNKRLRDMMGVAVIETDQKCEKDADPLTTDTNRDVESIEHGLKKEIADYDSFSDSCSEFDPSICQTQLFLDELKSEDSGKEVVDIKHNDSRKMLSFQCRYCPRSFEKKTSLAAHCKIHKNKDLSENNGIAVSNFQDDLEPTKKEIDNEPQVHDDNTDTRETKEFDSIDTGSANVEQSTCKYIFDCKVCGKTFDRYSNLQRHNSVHSSARPYECEICKYRFADPKLFKAHLFQHKSAGEQNIPLHLPEGYKCEVCQRNFMSMTLLAKHYKTQHPGVDRHKCEYCSRTFLLNVSLLKHISHRHKSDKSLSCPICQKEYGFERDLKQHMRIHNSYLCPQCGKTFRGAGNLHEHMERHTGLQKHQCPECPRRFNCTSDLQKHVKTHSNAKPHVCDICGSRFTRHDSMLKHKSLHTAERAFKCNQCNMTFKLIFLLKRHMLTHTGEKPHKCKYCERAYAASGDLTKHLRTHVGENTYMCDQCPMTFKYQSELRQHQSQHYKMNQKLLQKAQETSDETHDEKAKPECN